MKAAMSLGSTASIGTVVSSDKSRLKERTSSDAFVAGSIERMYLRDGAVSRSGFVLSQIASVATISALTSQSLTMNSRSSESCASYIGTTATPSPEHAYAATAHSTRL